MKSKPTNEWAELLQKALRTREKLPPGDGWSTREDIQEVMNFKRSSAMGSLRALSSTGVVEKFSGTQLKDGKLKVQTWYRIKRGKK